MGTAGLAERYRHSEDVCCAHSAIVQSMTRSTARLSARLRRSGRATREVRCAARPAPQSGARGMHMVRRHLTPRATRAALSFPVCHSGRPAVCGTAETGRVTPRCTYSEARVDGPDVQRRYRSRLRPSGQSARIFRPVRSRVRPHITTPRRVAPRPCAPTAPSRLHHRRDRSVVSRGHKL